MTHWHTHWKRESSHIILSFLFVLIILKYKNTQLVYRFITHIVYQGEKQALFLYEGYILIFILIKNMKWKSQCLLFLYVHLWAYYDKALSVCPCLLLKIFLTKLYKITRIWHCIWQNRRQLCSNLLWCFEF